MIKNYVIKITLNVSSVFANKKQDNKKMYNNERQMLLVQ